VNHRWGWGQTHRHDPDRGQRKAMVAWEWSIQPRFSILMTAEDIVRYSEAITAGKRMSMSMSWLLFWFRPLVCGHGSHALIWRPDMNMNNSYLDFVSPFQSFDQFTVLKLLITADGWLLVFLALCIPVTTGYCIRLYYRIIHASWGTRSSPWSKASTMFLIWHCVNTAQVLSELSCFPESAQRCLLRMTYIRWIYLPYNIEY